MHFLLSSITVLHAHTIVVNEAQAKKVQIGQSLSFINIGTIDDDKPTTANRSSPSPFTTTSHHRGGLLALYFFWTTDSVSPLICDGVRVWVVWWFKICISCCWNFILGSGGGARLWRWWWIWIWWWGWTVGVVIIWVCWWWIWIAVGAKLLRWWWWFGMWWPGESGLSGENIWQPK